jgi:hypothetical protein
MMDSPRARWREAWKRWPDFDPLGLKVDRTLLAASKHEL